MARDLSYAPARAVPLASPRRWERIKEAHALVEPGIAEVVALVVERRDRLSVKRLAEIPGIRDEETDMEKAA